MTRRERLERRAERLRAWADKREARGRSGFERARQMADAIPFGQPILVGHHSEKRDRNYRARIEGAFIRAHNDTTKARDMDSRAAGIEHALDRSIYSDDADAIEKLREKLDGLEARRDEIKRINAALRKKGATFAAVDMSDSDRAELVKLDHLQGYYKPLQRGFPPYVLQNLGGNITRARQRLALLEGQPARIEASRDGETATSRAGLRITETMTTPSRPGKKPRPVWNVTGAIGEWRQMLIGLDGRWYRGAFSFFEDPTEAIERACSEAERPPDPGPAPPCDPHCTCPDCITEHAAQLGDPIEEVAREIQTREAAAGELADLPFSLTSPISKAGGKQEGLF